MDIKNALVITAKAFGIYLALVVVYIFYVIFKQKPQR